MCIRDSIRTADPNRGGIINRRLDPDIPKESNDEADILDSGELSSNDDDGCEIPNPPPRQSPRLHPKQNRKSPGLHALAIKHNSGELAVKSNSGETVANHLGEIAPTLTYADNEINNVTGKFIIPDECNKSTRQKVIEQQIIEQAHNDSNKTHKHVSFTNEVKPAMNKNCPNINKIGLKQVVSLIISTIASVITSSSNTGFVFNSGGSITPVGLSLIHISEPTRPY